MSPRARQRRTGTGSAESGAPKPPEAGKEELKMSQMDVLIDIWRFGEDYADNEEESKKYEARLKHLLSTSKNDAGLPREFAQTAKEWAEEMQLGNMSEGSKLALYNQLEDLLIRLPDAPEDTRSREAESSYSEIDEDDDDGFMPDTLGGDPFGMTDAEDSGTDEENGDSDDDPSTPPASTAPTTSTPIVTSAPQPTTPVAGTSVTPEADDANASPESQEDEGGPEASENKKGFFATTHEKFRNGPLANFYRRFVGEKMPEDEEGYKAGWGGTAEKAGTIGMQIGSAIVGVKSFYDVPAFAVQSLATRWAKEGIKEALSQKETELAETGRLGGEVAIQQKIASVTNAIQESNYLTKKQKEDLTKQITEKIRRADAHKEAVREQRNQEIAQLLDKAITTRISRQEAVKQAINSALKYSGYNMFRASAYGYLALRERHKKVWAEMKEQNIDRKQYFNKFVVEGLKDTAHKLAGGDAKSWKGRMVNRIGGGLEALRPVLIASGIGAEAMEEAGEVVDALIEKYEGVDQRAVGKVILDTMSNSAHAAEAPPVDTADTGDTEVMAEPTDARLQQEAAVAGQSVDAVPEASLTPETLSLSDTEVFEGQKELALTRKEDGIIKIINRQLRENPEAFGYNAANDDNLNAWVQKTSMEAARAQELIRTGGDTRLTEDAIGRLTVIAQTKEDGGIEISFFDGETKMSPTELEAQGLTYEGGTRPGIVATNAEATLRQPDRIEAGTEVFQDSDAPDSFVENGHGEYALWLEKEDGVLTAVRFKEGMEMKDPSAVYDSMNMDAVKDLFRDTSTEVWSGYIENLPETNQDLVATYAIIQQLEKDGLGQGPEAQALRALLADQLDTFDHQTKGIDVFNEATIDAMRAEAAEYAEPTGTAIEDGSIRVRGLGKIEFTGGNPPINLEKITSEFGPMFQKKADAIMTDGWESKLLESGLEYDAVKGAQDAALRISVMNSSLNELEAAGFGDSPEAQLIRKTLATELSRVGSYVNPEHEIMASALKHAERGGLDLEELNDNPLEDTEDKPVPPSSVQPAAPPQAAAVPVTTPGIAPAADTGEPGGELVIRGEGGKLERGIYKSDSGRIKFSYGPDGNIDGITMKSKFFGQDGSPFSAMPILKEEGVTHREVVNFDLNRRQTDFDYDVFERNIVRLERQQEILADMKADGMENTPEYKALAQMNARVEAEKSMWIRMIKAAREPSPVDVQRAQAQAALRAQAFAERRQAIAEGTGT